MMEPWRTAPSSGGAGAKRPGPIKRRAIVAIALALALSAPAASAAADGAALYQRNCGPCHGPTARGGGVDAGLFQRRPPNLREAFADRPTDVVVRRILDGGSLQLPLELPALRARARDTEAVIGYMRRLPRTDWNTVNVGAARYAARCALCHGPYGHPAEELPPGVRPPRDLAEPHIQALRNAELITAVRHGRDGMPALVPRVNEADAGAIAAQVRLFSPGFEIYSQYCAACHGADGRPVGAGPPTVVFDTTFMNDRDPERLRRDVWHMVDEHQARMPHFRGTLSPAEAEAIADWIADSQP